MERYRLQEYIIEDHGGSLLRWHKYVLGNQPATDELIGGRARVTAGVLRLSSQEHGRGAFKPRRDMAAELASLPAWDSTSLYEELPTYGGGVRDCRTGEPSATQPD